MSRPSEHTPRFSTAIEDYLRAILTLAGEDGQTTVCAVAEQLDVARASSSQMVRRLVNLDLVHHDPYGGVGLTSTGQAAAGEILRRYRLIESYLVTTLGYHPDDVARDADRIEHAMSADLTDRLAAVLTAPDAATSAELP
jgi:DtxR family Mn-dependent transcriptional regulator